MVIVFLNKKSVESSILHSYFFSGHALLLSPPPRPLPQSRILHSRHSQLGVLVFPALIHAMFSALVFFFFLKTCIFLLTPIDPSRLNFDVIFSGKTIHALSPTTASLGFDVPVLYAHSTPSTIDCHGPTNLSSLLGQQLVLAHPTSSTVIRSSSYCVSCWVQFLV